MLKSGRYSRRENGDIIWLISGSGEACRGSVLGGGGYRLEKGRRQEATEKRFSGKTGKKSQGQRVREPRSVKEITREKLSVIGQKERPTCS